MILGSGLNEQRAGAFVFILLDSHIHAATQIYICNGDILMAITADRRRSLQVQIEIEIIQSTLRQTLPTVIIRINHR